MQWPVSVKAVLGWGDRYVLLRNDRGEWELPGGRLELGEQPTEALEREVSEELSIEATVGPLVLAEVFEVVPRRWVLLLAYRCDAARPGELSFSEEHQDVTTASLEELEQLPIPQVYVRAIEQARRAA